MCLAFAGKIIKLDKKGEQALVDFGNAKKWVSILLTPDVKEGEVVMVHAGFAIERLREG